MSRRQPRSSLEPRDLQAHDGKLPEILWIPECSRDGTARSSQQQKLPVLTSDHRFPEKQISGKSFGSHLFESSWKNAVIKTKRIKQEYTSAYGLKDSNENIAVPSLIQGSEKYSVIPTSSLAAKKTQSADDPSTNSNDDPNLPPLYLLPSTSSQYPIGSFYKSKGDIAFGDIGKRAICSWKPGPLKTPGMHCGMRELGVVRLRKYNRCSSLISFPGGSKFKSGYHFTDPVSGAPPEYIQRLSELAALECETIHQEKSRRTRKSRKLEM